MDLRSTRYTAGRRRTRRRWSGFDLTARIVEHVRKWRDLSQRSVQRGDGSDRLPEIDGVAEDGRCGYRPRSGGLRDFAGRGIRLSDGGDHARTVSRVLTQGETRGA